VLRSAFYAVRFRFYCLRPTPVSDVISAANNASTAVESCAKVTPVAIAASMLAIFSDWSIADSDGGLQKKAGLPT